MRNFHTYRAIMGGVWEEYEGTGWHRLTEDEIVGKACRITAGVLRREDHRVWHSYIVLGTVLTVAACVAALTIAIRGV